ncbi:phytoene desaturase family protein [Bradymonas sediminis]|uniref:Uncharacterized protein n=1 Tax=Bradymonas sediminis TaxID=1548548 RepID=A0A2Z4FHD6_9DELT|nr:phytoene desaturase family protein [Bradymonas sediminis]AWV88397.1 hypothetical protein DN745_03165 [Bradymonas sediminis]TDP77524.1 1-hydroxycarotenoid 3,4-desaturase [Bradymonas sediminis]
MMSVAIIGAGIGGLSAALELAAKGVKVTVFEAASAPGGKIGVGQHDGVEFDTGPSLLTMPEVFEDLFRLAGTSLADEVELVESAPYMRYHYPDGVRLDIYPDLDQSIAAIGQQLGSRASGEFADFMRYAGKIWESAAPNFIFSQAPSLGSMARLGLSSLTTLWSIDPLHTMLESIDKRVESQHLRHLLARFATYNGSDPRSAPATLNCIAWVEMGQGARGVRGGIIELARALHRRALALGVDFRFDSPVLRLHRPSGAGEARGVETASGVFKADAVVVNADVRHLVETLLPGANIASASSNNDESSLNADAPASMSGWTGVIRAKRRPEGERLGHEVFFPEDYIQEFRDIFDHKRAPTDPTVYVCAQEKAHQRTGWAEDEALFIMANAPPESSEVQSSAQDWAPLRDAMLKRLRNAAAIDPGDALIWERSPAQLAAQFPGSRGALYGAASNSKFAAFQRPQNRVKEIPGLYLASGSAHPGGGVPLCAQSGRLAAQAIHEDFGRSQKQKSPARFTKRHT